MSKPMEPGSKINTRKYYSYLQKHSFLLIKNRVHGFGFQKSEFNVHQH